MYVRYLQSTHDLIALCKELISADLLGFIHVWFEVSLPRCVYSIQNHKIY
jgi:hypothetical protein